MLWASARASEPLAKEPAPAAQPTTRAPAVAAPPHRREAIDAPDEVRQQPIAPAMTFEQGVARLCELSTRTAVHAADDEIEAAQDTDRQARELLAELLRAFADAGDRALAMTVEMAGTPAGTVRTPGENTRLGVLQVILAAELSRRHDDAAAGGDRSRVDELTMSVLDSMPIGATTAEMGDRILHRRPYLQPAHEPMVLHLLQLAGEGEFSREVATRLLLTLWDNL
ncbi:MAG: hypothetical protein KAI24_23695 [Planctomycetes bacterium]|nr:hypothetical protein [Planctomycetota bacterium]